MHLPKNFFIIAIFWAVFSISECVANTPISTNKIKVLNVGTFHFGETSDAYSVDFDEEDEKLQIEVRAISKMLSEFKPTIICVEDLPENNEIINAAYKKFLKNPLVLNTKYGETSMVAFDVARLSGVQKIYGIDNHMGYNYSIGDFIERSPDYQNAIDPVTYLELTRNPLKHDEELATRDAKFDTLTLVEKLQLTNHPKMLDYSININADKLLYVGIDNGFEGADQAAIFYQRNMRIYSNLNRIKMTPNDRVFILMGSAHTAFLREFINRSPKFEMVNTLDYL